MATISTGFLNPIRYEVTDYHIPVPWDPSGLARVREMVPVSSHLLLQDKETLTLHKQYLAIFESGSKRFNSDFVLGDETPDLDHIDLSLKEHNPTSTSYSPETTHSPLLAPILTIPPLETDLCINPESLHQSTVVDNETVIPASSGRLRPDGSKKKSPKVPSKKPPKVPSKKPPKVLSKKPLEKTAETNTQSQQVEQCQVPGCGEMVLVTAANIEAHAGRKHCPKDVKESICEWPGCTKKLQSESFRRHLLIHFCGRLTCDLCAVNFVRVDSYDRHIRRSKSHREKSEALALSKPRRSTGRKRTRDVSFTDDDEDDDYTPNKKSRY